MRGPWLALALAFGVAACAANGGDPLAEDAAAVRGGEPIPYEVQIDGVDAELESYLRSVSESVAGSEEPPSSMLAIRRRAAGDEERLTRALAGEGYYEGRVDAEVVEPTGADPAASIRFRITPGPRYRLDELVISALAPDVYVPPSPRALGLEQGTPAVAQRVIDAEQRLVQEAREAGFAYAQAGDRRAVIDRDADTLSVRLRIDTGPRIDLEAPDFAGIDGIGQSFIESRVAWTSGDTYSPAAITATRRALVDTGLFQLVDVKLPEEPPADGRADVTIVTDQRLHRTIGGGVRYETDGGPGFDVRWEHRNAFGAAERLRVRLDANTLVQQFDVALRTPDFYGRSRSSVAEATAVREDTDAFESLAVDASFGIEQRFSDNLEGTLGLGYELSEVTDNRGTETFGLLFAPAVLRYDTTDNPLDATEGLRARLAATPFWDLFSPDLAFQRFRIDASTYVKITSDPRLVLAVRGALGSIVGAERDDIPANRRFYAGGGGSIRGVPFQTAAPLDDNDDPLGGRSLLELSAELRYDLTESIGVVGFLDGGRAFEASFPDFEDPLVFGTGLGLRYFTGIGPVRLDVAVPVDRREVDDAFQFYVSLGQAF